ncbi:MAG: DNA repair protein RecN [Flavobacteriales bacterium]|nr:DNA repair protein RecN [Flavobacteriales bacterium]
MISNLSISNYAIIKELNISFNQGFTTITGETGAGKSILLGALSLILGERADTQVLRDELKKCVVEGEFSIAAYQLEEFFEQNDLDYLPQTFIRREINPAGRSRAFINDTPVTLNQLKALGGQLVDVHSQHQTLLLNKHAFQLKVVDAFAQHKDLLTTYRKVFNKWKEKQSLFKQLQSQESTQQLDVDYKQFLLTELEETNIQDGDELSNLEEELKFLENAEEIQQKLQESIQLADLSEYSILGQLQTVKSLLQSIAPNHEKIRVLADRVESTYIELKDMLMDAESIAEGVEHNPEQLAVISERVSNINKLLQKHQLVHPEQLIALQEQLSQELSSVNSLGEQLVELKKEVDKSHKQANELALKISQNRAEIIPTIERELGELLSGLGMPNAKVQINQHPSEEIHSNGKEEIVFYFSTNKGGSLQEISKIASGGELSRLMLCIKYLMANKTQLPSIIFDEIDTGVSGEIAHKMGDLMKQMASSMQVMGITHLPQVAAKGSDQLLVKKDNTQEFTETKLHILSKEERVQELAKMLSGSEVTETAISNAQELLGA